MIDSQKEATAIKEAKKLGIPVIGVVDTNCDPDEIDFPIPANDDAIRSIKLLTSIIAEAVISGREAGKPVEEREGVAIPEEEKIVDTEGETMEEAMKISEEERLSALAPKIKVEEEEEEREGF